MKSNINMTNGVVKSGEFTYVRQQRILKAYGKEYPIPVRTVEFADKLEAVSKEMGQTITTADTISKIREGIMLFIGAEETDCLFPADKLQEIDVDEIMAFWQALNFELQRNQQELIAKYRPAPNIRK